MRRVLVPLDGSDLSSSILDEARRLAGAGGELILMRLTAEREDAGEAQRYLDGLAERLRTHGTAVSTLALETRNIPLAIDEAANATWADVIACATYSQDTAEPALRGSIAWRVLAHSPVPVLLRRSVPGEGNATWSGRRHIMVPLDGSALAESALPLTLDLAKEWHALVSLVRVDHGPTGSGGGEPSAAGAYLSRIAAGLSHAAECHVLTGSTVEALAGFIVGAAVSDIVMASHGRTGLSRLVLGSVAYDLIHRVSVPTVVVPASAVEGYEPRVR